MTKQATSDRLFAIKNAQKLARKWSGENAMLVIDETANMDMTFVSQDVWLGTIRPDGKTARWSQKTTEAFLTWAEQTEASNGEA